MLLKASERWKGRCGEVHRMFLTILFCHCFSCWMVRLCFRCCKSDFGIYCIFCCFCILCLQVRKAAYPPPLSPLLLTCLSWWLRAVCLHGSANLSSQDTRIMCGLEKQTSTSSTTSKRQKNTLHHIFVVYVKTCRLIFCKGLSDGVRKVVVKVVLVHDSDRSSQEVSFKQ